MMVSIGGDSLDSLHYEYMLEMYGLFSGKQCCMV